LLAKAKKLIIFSLCSIFMVPSVGGAAVSPFSDVSGHYAEQGVTRLYEEGVVTGYPDGRFYPARHVNRAEYLKMLMSIVPVEPLLYGPIPFDQLKGHWAFPYLEQTYRSGAMLDSNWNLIEPQLEENVNRGEAALLLANAMGLDLNLTYPNPYTDTEALPTTVKQAILALSDKGILAGMTADSFQAEGLLERGQVSVIFARALSYQEKEWQKRMELIAVIQETAGEVTAEFAGKKETVQVGDVLEVGTEIRTESDSSVTIELTTGDTIFIGPSSHVTIEDLDVSVAITKPGQVKAQATEDGNGKKEILLRGKALESNVNLNWLAEGEFDGYSVFRAKNESISADNQPVMRQLRNSLWNDKNVEPGNTYYYRVMGSTESEQVNSQIVSFEIIKKVSVKAWLGNVFVKAKSLFSESSSVEIHTPTTTAGIRGTTFSVEVDRSGRSHVGVYSGQVALYKPGGTVANQQIQLVEPNQQAVVTGISATPQVNPLQVAEASAFVKESLAKVLTQQQEEKKKEQERLKQLQAKLEAQIQAQQQQLEQQKKLKEQQQAALLLQILEQTKIEKQRLAQIEQQKKEKERQLLEAIYEQNKEMFDSIVKNQFEVDPAATTSSSSSGTNRDNDDDDPAPEPPVVEAVKLTELNVTQAVLVEPYNHEEQILGTVAPNSGAELTPDMIKFDIVFDTTVTAEDIKLTAYLNENGEIEISATTSKAGEFIITPYVGTLDATDAIAGSAFALTTTVNPTVLSLDLVQFDSTELTVGSTISRELVFKNKYDEVVDGYYTDLTVVEDTGLNYTLYQADRTVSDAAGNVVKYIDLSASEAGTYGLHLVVNGVVQEYSLQFTDPVLAFIEVGSDIIGVDVGDLDSTKTYQEISFLDQNRTKMSQTVADLTVSVTKPDGTLLADYTKLLTLANSFTKDNLGVIIDSMNTTQDSDVVVGFTIFPDVTLSDGDYTITIKSTDGSVADSFIIRVGSLLN
jgi:hypothetical protein